MASSKKQRSVSCAAGVAKATVAAKLKSVQFEVFGKVQGVFFRKVI